MEAMAAGVAGTIPGIMVRGIVLTGLILTGIVPIGAGAGEAGMAAGTIHGMIHGIMEGIMAIMAVSMEAITADITVAGTEVTITDRITPAIRADGRQRHHTVEAAAVQIMFLPPEEE